MIARDRRRASGKILIRCMYICMYAWICTRERDPTRPDLVMDIRIQGKNKKINQATVLHYAISPISVKLYFDFNFQRYRRSIESQLPTKNFILYIYIFFFLFDLKQYGNCYNKDLNRTDNFVSRQAILKRPNQTAK